MYASTKQQLAEFEAKNAEAAGLSATCPRCGSRCNVHAQFKQATRREPMQFLGFGAYCMGDCYSPFGGGMYFQPETVQERLIA